MAVRLRADLASVRVEGNFRIVVNESRDILLLDDVDVGFSEAEVVVLLEQLQGSIVGVI